MDASGKTQSSSTEFFLPNYRMGKTLGIGSFGKVKVAEHVLTGHKVAIKILNRRKIKAMDMEEKVRREIKILRLFMHPHIIRLYEVVETPTDIFVVMEYVKSGELFDYIVEKGRLGEAEVLRFFQQILAGVEYAHRNMVVHRDLKPENLLLDSRLNVKIADFGLSNVMRDGHFLKTSCGSPNYAAPEVISGRLYAGPEVDVWSCGVILYALLCGSLPFDDENIPNLFKKIKGAIYTLPSHLSAGARDLIPRMLYVDPLKRITIPEIRQHSWFSTHLPRYLSVPPPDTITQAQRVDPDTLEAVVKTGFDRQMVIDSLRQRLHNKLYLTHVALSRSQTNNFKGRQGGQRSDDGSLVTVNKATVAYYLILDNSWRSASSTNYTEGEKPDQQMQRQSGHMATQAYGQPVAPRSQSNTNPVVQTRMVAERHWSLGVHTRRSPADIMAEVFRALQALGIGWKRHAPYNIKCRHVIAVPHLGPAPCPEMGRAEVVLKFEVQVYRLKEEKYMVDIQRLDGPLYCYLDLIDRVVAELKLS